MPVGEPAWDVCIVAREEGARGVAVLRAARAGSMCREERLRCVRRPGDGRWRCAVRRAPAEEKALQGEGRE